MPSWLKELLSYNPLISLGCSIWNCCMDVVRGLLLVSPADIGGGSAWAALTADIYPVFLSVGVTLLGIFFMIGFCTEAADLRQGMTFEKSVWVLLRLVFANFVLTTAIAWIPQLFSLAGGLGNFAAAGADLDAAELSEEADGLLGFFSCWFLCLLFLLASLICGLMIVWTVYKRYLHLMMLVVMAPPAFATIAGGRGLSHSASSWIRAFLGNCFEIVVIGLGLRLGGLLTSGGGLLSQAVDTSWPIPIFPLLEMILSMVLLVGAVYGAEGLLRRAYGF